VSRYATLPAQPKGIGPNGRPFCRWCGVEVPGLRRSWCSDKCVDEYSIRANGNVMRRKLFERDRGICVACGFRAEAFNQHLHSWYLERYPDGYTCWRRTILHETRQMVENFGVNLNQSLWEADHIHPVEHGGGGCGLDNIQTLCHWCHVRKTAEQARERARARRRQPTLPEPPVKEPPK